MNPYGHMAMEHWRKYRPEEFSRIADPTTFFQKLGQEIESRILDRVEEMEQEIPKGLPDGQRMTRSLAIRPDAERDVLQEMLPRAEDDETGE
jgi:hypothetical protein